MGQGFQLGYKSAVTKHPSTVSMVLVLSGVVYRSSTAVVCALLCFIMYHRIGGRVGPRASLYSMEKRKTLALARNKTMLHGLFSL